MVRPRCCEQGFLKAVGADLSGDATAALNPDPSAGEGLAVVLVENLPAGPRLPIPLVSLALRRRPFSRVSQS